MSKSRTVSWFRQARAGEMATIVLIITAALTPGAADAVAGEWEIHGPPGYVSALAVAPSDPKVIYGGEESGVVKSLDGGHSWQSANGNLPLSTTAVDIAVDPTDPDTVYFATNLNDGPGVFKTTDGGNIWHPRGQGLFPESFHVVIVDPVQPDTVYAGAGLGIDGPILYKSTDGAGTWVDITSEEMGHSIQSIAIDPSDHERLYVGTPGEGGGDLFTSTDGGATWYQSSRGLPGAILVSALAVDPSDPSVVWAGRGGYDAPTLYRSIDGGRNWSGMDPAVFTTGVNDVAIDPADPSIVYVGTEDGVIRTTDGGGTWAVLSSGPARAEAVQVDPSSPFTVYATGLPLSPPGIVGVYKSTDGGDTWKTYIEGLPGGYVEAVGFDPTNPDIVYAGDSSSQNPILYKSVDGGRHWTPYRMDPGITDFTAILVDPEDPSTVYAAGLYSVLKSTDAGRTWGYADAGLDGSVFDLVMNPSNTAHLVVGGDGIYESIDGALSWRLLTDASPVSAVAIDPTDPDIVYAGSFGEPFEPGLVYRTTNGGGTWKILYRIRGHDRDVEDIAVDPSDPATVYVAIGSHAEVGIIIKSTDGGRTWVELKVSTEVGAITDLAIVPSDPSIIWAGSGSGVFLSTDGGLHWTPMSDGLRAHLVLDIVVDETGSLLYAANGGGGIARLEVL